MASPPCYPAYWQTLGGRGGGGGGGLVDCLYWKYKRCGLWASTTLTWWPLRGLLALAAKGSVVCRVQSVIDKAIPYPPPHHCKNNNKKQKKTNWGNKAIHLAKKNNIKMVDFQHRHNAKTTTKHLQTESTQANQNQSHNRTSVQWMNRNLSSEFSTHPPQLLNWWNMYKTDLRISQPNLKKPAFYLKLSTNNWIFLCFFFSLWWLVLKVSLFNIHQLLLEWALMSTLSTSVRGDQG